MPAPTSVVDTHKSIVGKSFVTDRVGTVSPFTSGMDREQPNRWFDEEKELNDFAKEYQTERKSFILEFVNDTLLKVTDDGKIWDAFYKIDEAINENEKSGMKLRFSYPDQEGNMNFPGAIGPMILTSSYLIAGKNEKEMILETTRKFNNSTVVVWMKEK